MQGSADVFFGWMAKACAEAMLLNCFLLYPFVCYTLQKLWGVQYVRFVWQEWKRWAGSSGRPFSRSCQTAQIVARPALGAECTQDTYVIVIVHACATKIYIDIFISVLYIYIDYCIYCEKDMDVDIIVCRYKYIHIYIYKIRYSLCPKSGTCNLLACKTAMPTKPNM